MCLHFLKLLPPVHLAFQACCQMSRFSITLLHVLACLHHVLCLTRQCYDPPGTVANLDTPCTDDLDTFCCPSGWACLGNRVCEYTPWSNTAYDRPFFRASCTDPTWTSSACPLFCDSYPNATTGGRSDNIRKSITKLTAYSQHHGYWGQIHAIMSSSTTQCLGVCRHH